MKIGFHLSISKGFTWTRREADRLGCEVVQIFVKNPRGWGRKELTEKDREEFAGLARAVSVYAHLSYLPNIAKIDEDERNLSGLIHEAGLCAQLGIQHLVVHCGSRPDRAVGLRRAAEAIDRVLSVSPISILLENASGQGNSLGRNLSELASIFEHIREKERVSLCLDTAHLFQAGYDVRLKRTWNDIDAEVGKRLGRNRIGFFHLNDSKTPLASGVDRHWHLGKGLVGADAFKIVVNDKKYAHLCGVMETPKMGNMDEENMNTLRSYFLL